MSEEQEVLQLEFEADAEAKWKWWKRLSADLLWAMLNGFPTNYERRLELCKGLECKLWWGSENQSCKKFPSKDEVDWVISFHLILFTVWQTT